MTVVYIKDLVVMGRHGIHDWEKKNPQRFRFNLELTVDTAPAAVSDKLADTVDYAELRRIIVESTENDSYNLLERLAQVIVDRVLDDKRVRKLALAIDKPDTFESGTPGVKVEITT